MIALYDEIHTQAAVSLVVYDRISTRVRQKLTDTAVVQCQIHRNKYPVAPKLSHNDDCQIYASFDHRVPDDMENTLAKITECIVEIRRWLSANYLKLNESKSGLFFFFIAGSNYNLKHIDMDNIGLTIGNSNVKILPVICNLGCFLNSHMSLTAHIDNLRKTILFHI